MKRIFALAVSMFASGAIANTMCGNAGLNLKVCITDSSDGTGVVSFSTLDQSNYANCPANISGKIWSLLCRFETSFSIEGNALIERTTNPIFTLTKSVTEGNQPYAVIEFKKSTQTDFLPASIMVKP